MSQLDSLLTAFLHSAEPLLQPARDQTFQWFETGKGTATLVERNEFSPSLSFAMASMALKTTQEYKAAKMHISGRKCSSMLSEVLGTGERSTAC